MIAQYFTEYFFALGQLCKISASVSKYSYMRILKSFYNNILQYLLVSFTYQWTFL